MTTPLKKSFFTLLAILSFNLASRQALAAGCTARDVDPQLQNLRAERAKKKFSQIPNCQPVVDRMKLYDGSVPKEIGEATQRYELLFRCNVTKELLNPAVSTCAAAKAKINELEVSAQLEKKMPGYIAQVAAAQAASLKTEESKKNNELKLDSNPTGDIGAQPGVEAPKSSDSDETKLTFLGRFLNAYKESSDTQPAPPANYRGYPAPLNSPPYPNAVWPIGGTSNIGQPNPVTDTPLMQAIGTKSALGQSLQSLRINIYGWANGGGNISTSQGAGYANAPAAYYQKANNVQVDQLALFVERVPDTVQNDHFDWGFRVTGFYGLDYRFTTALGILSNQLIKNNQQNGVDFPMAYVDLYYPVMDGLNIRVGRFISVPDIEAQLATSNYMYSHSLMYSYDAYTQTGVVATLKMNDHVTVQGGLTAGNDVAPWQKGAQPTGLLCFGYTWSQGNQNVYVCDNSINSGKYAYNNMNQYNATYYVKLNNNWHMATEVYYMKESDVPAVGGPLPTYPNSNPGYFAPGLIAGTMHAVGGVNYLVRNLDSNTFLTFRNGFLWDPNGQRTGYPTVYSDNAIGLSHWIMNKRILLRPEIANYHSFLTPAFNNGKKKNEAIIGGDAVVIF
jgi:hypothetical protein